MGTQRTHRPAEHRAVGYVRRSTDRQEQSIADQKRALEAYVGEHGLRLGKFYIDDAVSGTSTVGRRAFQQMMQGGRWRQVSHALQRWKQSRFCAHCSQNSSSSWVTGSGAGFGTAVDSLMAISAGRRGCRRRSHPSP